ncbi:MAG TPA: hypothetical protein VIN39_06980 [Candidatus Dormibacteraeota bacterium]|jgi:hypothetical protein
MEFIGAFESTYLPRHDIDVLETTGHTRRWKDEVLGYMREAGFSPNLPRRCWK